MKLISCSQHRRSCACWIQIHCWVCLNCTGWLRQVAALKRRDIVDLSTTLRIPSMMSSIDICVQHSSTAESSYSQVMAACTLQFNRQKFNHLPFPCPYGRTPIQFKDSSVVGVLQHHHGIFRSRWLP